MPVSTLDPAALAGLLPADLVDLALERDRARRAALARGDVEAALEADLESAALASLYRARLP